LMNLYTIELLTTELNKAAALLTGLGVPMDVAGLTQALVKLQLMKQ